MQDVQVETFYRDFSIQHPLLFMFCFLSHNHMHTKQILHKHIMFDKPPLIPYLLDESNWANFLILFFFFSNSL